MIMEQKYLLSIVIPTFNRRNYLQENLILLIPQIKKYKAEVQLVVSNNASTDGTKEMLETIQKKIHFQFEVYTQAQKLDIDESMLFVASKAKGKYMMIMGDDDILSPNFIEIILGVIKSGTEYGMIHWNILTGDANCDNNQLYNIHFDGKLECICSPTELICKEFNHSDFISSVIIRKECWDIAENLDTKAFSGYGFMFRNYQGIIKKGLPCLYYYFPLVIQRNPHKDWINLWPYYHIVSLRNGYKFLDEIMPHTHLLKNHQDKCKKCDWDILVGVSFDRKFYKEHLPEMIPYITKNQLLWTRFWLNVPLPRIWRKLYWVYKNIKRRIVGK